MALIDELEKYRKDNGLSPDDMAELFGLPVRQNYDHWVRRGKVSRDYIERAIEIVRSADKLSEREQELIDAWRQLSVRAKKMVLVQLKALLAEDA